MHPILAGKKFTPPIKGDATIDYVKSPTRREGETLITNVDALEAALGGNAGTRVRP